MFMRDCRISSCQLEIVLARWGGVESLRQISSRLLRKRDFLTDSCPTSQLQFNDRAISKRERGRSRFPHREPIGLHPRRRVDRTLPEREGNDPAASPCLKSTDYARNPRTSRAAPRVAVFAERPSSPELTAEHTPGDSEVESMRCYREIALDRCPAQPVRRCNRRPGRQARRPS